MQVFNFFINNWDKILTIMVGLVAIIIYKIQKRDEKKNAAILIVTQIDDLKDKISQIVELTTNNQLNAAGIYETLDILEENQWNKYKHLFVGSIDIKSLKIINDFYEGVSLIREQLVLSKKLQQQAFFNNQQFLGQDCNMYLIDSLNEKDRFNYTGIKDASYGYFKKSPKDLTFYEATYLAGLPNAPSVYSENEKLGEERRLQVVEAVNKYSE